MSIGLLDLDPKKVLEVRMDPIKFAKIADFYQNFTIYTDVIQHAAYTDLKEKVINLDRIYNNVKDIVDAMNQAESQSTRRKRSGGQFYGDDNGECKYSGADFIHFVFEIIKALKSNMGTINDLVEGLRPAPLFRMGSISKVIDDEIKSIKDGDLKSVLSKDLDKRIGSMDDMQKLMMEMQFNMPTIQRFITSMEHIDTLNAYVSDFAHQCLDRFENYYQILLHRHRTSGLKIHENAILTDVALMIYENVDHNGEIQEGAKPNEISSYSKNKAQVLAQAVMVFHEFIVKPTQFLNLVVDQLLALERINDSFKPMRGHIKEFRDLLGLYKAQKQNHHPIGDFLKALLLLNFESLTYKEPEVMLTREEKFNLKFQNESLATITRDIKHKLPYTDLVDYILERKAELKKFFQEENSFYVCKIANGNPFGGEAPGALKVIPGPRPLADLDEIIGSGFGNIKEFLREIETAEKWHDLFVATSPSRSGDKSNVLLVGPQGCGKSEILRAVGGDKNSIGIFAQGSDFLTCWYGEAEKNPKRLFESGLKLQKESGRHIHFLIDEIDMILNNDQGMSKSNNLTLEFQILMDGVVSYPHISLWGATNNPQRIPTPMIRRFNKVAIVGELDQDDRVKLLKHFCNFMPVKSFKNSHWNNFGKKLDGATGDIIRKVVDQIWRSKMSTFVSKHPEEAEELVKMLNDQGKFEISEFTGDERRNLREKLKNLVHIGPTDVEKSIDENLANFAIQREIQVAVSTYKAAHTMLSDLKQKAVA